MTSFPPVRREILVDADPETAFEVFTGRIGRGGRWASTASTARAHGGLRGRPDRRALARRGQAVWGTVTRWEPPGAVAFSWHPGQPDRASRVEVTFAAADGQTLVTAGAQGLGGVRRAGAARDEYGRGWAAVLAATVMRGAAARRPAGDVGRAAAPGRSGRAHGGDGPRGPQFAGHLGFLGRMRDAGYLVAAGPLPDAAGEG